jgi:membrane protein implicated in regulation of membrane protease activity
MTVYAYSEVKIEKLINRSKRIGFRYALTSFVVLIVATAVLYFFRELLRVSLLWTLPFLAVFFLFPLVRIAWNWRRWPQKQRDALKKVAVELSGDVVRVADAGGRDVRLDKSEIVRAEDASWSTGLCLRTANRYQWYLIPRTLDDFDAIKRDLTGINIPVIETRIPPNWEEFIGACLYCGTLLCTLIARKPDILALNLLVASLVSGGAVYVVRANPQSAGQRTKLTLGALLPTIAAAGAFWMSVHTR